MNRTQGRKISRFPGAAPVIPSDAYFEFVSGGVNYKIAYPDLLTNLNVIGTIVQDGDPLGVPILDPQGSVHNIRNFEAGAGIQAAVSPQNGLAVAHNFTVDVAGIPIMLNPTAPSPIFRSLVAGSGINIGAAGGQIQISTSAVPVSTKTVVINQLSDLPAPVLGVITLAPDTQYFIFNDINLGTNRLVVGNNTTIFGSSPNVITLSYSGAGDMITGVDSNFTISQITLFAPTGRVFNFSNPGSTVNFLCNNVIISVCDRVGVFNGARSVLFFLTGIRGYNTGGVELLGTINGFCGGVFCSWVAGAGPCWDLVGATALSSVNISDQIVFLTNGASIFIRGAGDANIVNSAAVFNARITNTGGGTPLVGVNPITDARWTFRFNDIIADSRALAVNTLVNNAVATVIAAANTPVLIAGAWVPGNVSLFTASPTGRLTYNGFSPIQVTSTASLSVLMAAGAANKVFAYVALNGVPIPGTQISGTASATDVQCMSTLWSSTLNPGDFVELWIANAVDADDIIVVDASLRVAA